MDIFWFFILVFMVVGQWARSTIYLPRFFILKLTIDISNSIEGIIDIHVIAIKVNDNITNFLAGSAFLLYFFLFFLRLWRYVIELNLPVFEDIHKFAFEA